MLDPKDRKHIVGLVAENENGVLEASSCGYGEIWKEYGYSYEIIDLFQPDGITRLSLALGRKDLSFVFGFAGVGSQLENDKGQNLWEAMRIPFVSLWYDHPCYNYRQHAVDSSYVINVYHVRDHYDVHLKYFPSHHTTLLLPPIALRFARLNRLPLRARNESLLMVKTADNPATYESVWQDYPPILRDMLHDLSARAIKDRNIDLADETAKVFLEKGLNVPQVQDDFWGVVQEVDRYVRAWRSDKMARALLPHDAILIGRGWDYLDAHPHRAVLSGPCSPQEFNRRMVRARLSINVNPLWRDGFHERVVHSLMHGSIAITDRTERTDKLLSSLPFYCPFDWDDDLSDVLAQALVLAGKKEDYSLAGHQMVVENFLVSFEQTLLPIEQSVLQLSRH